MIAGQFSPSGTVDIFFIFLQLRGMRWDEMCDGRFARQMRQRWRDGEEEVEEESS